MSIYGAAGRAGTQPPLTRWLGVSVTDVSSVANDDTNTGINALTLVRPNLGTAPQEAARARKSLF